MKILERLIKTPEGDLIDSNGKGKQQEQKDSKDDNDPNKKVDDKPCQNRPFANLTRAFKKIRHEKVLDQDDKTALRNFVNEYTTCSLSPSIVGADVARIAFEVNRHHHTKTCKKYLQQLLEQNICRFGYRKYPFPETIIVEPCRYSGDEREKKFQKWSEILSKVKEVIENDEIIAGIMSKYNKANETKEEYLANRKKRIEEVLTIAEVTMPDYEQALSTSRAGYSVVLERDIDETDVNSYNIEM